MFNADIGQGMSGMLCKYWINELIRFGGETKHLMMS